LISVPQKLRLQLEKDNFSLYPLVVISPDENPIYLSTNPVTKNGIFFSPILLSVNSFRESIDLFKYNARTSKISIYISDREYSGEKLSDSFNNLDFSLFNYIINKPVRVYFSSDGLELEDSIIIYDGVCVNHIQKELTIQLVIESKLGLIRNIPDILEPLDLQDGIFSKYINRLSPIIMGADAYDREVFIYKEYIDEVIESNYLIDHFGLNGPYQYDLYVTKVNNETFSTNYPETLFTIIKGHKYYVVNDPGDEAYISYLDYIVANDENLETLEPLQFAHSDNGEDDYSGFLSIRSVGPKNMIATGRVVVRHDFSSTKLSAVNSIGMTNSSGGHTLLVGASSRDSMPGIYGTGPGWYANVFSYGVDWDREQYIWSNEDYWWGDATNLPADSNYDKHCVIRPDFISKNDFTFSNDAWIKFDYTLKITCIGVDRMPSSGGANISGFTFMIFFPPGITYELTDEFLTDEGRMIFGNIGPPLPEGSGYISMTYTGPENPADVTISNPGVLEINTRDHPELHHFLPAQYFQQLDNQSINYQIMNQMWDIPIIAITQDTIAGIYVEIIDIDYQVYETIDLYNSKFYCTNVAQNNPTRHLPATTHKQPIELYRKLGVDYSEWKNGLDTIYNNVQWLSGPSRTTVNITKQEDILKYVDKFSQLFKFAIRYDGWGKITTANFRQSNSGNAGVTKAIKASDVIKFSYSRSDKDELYTRVKCPYGYSPATKTFAGEVEYGVMTNDSSFNVLHPNYTIEEATPDIYSFQYYGLIKEYDGNREIDESSTTFIIPDELAKLINVPTSVTGGEVNRAETVAKLWVHYHMNLHLELSLRLPIKYIDLECGDFIIMDSLIGDIKPFGIDYVKPYTEIGDIAYSGVIINGQQCYNAFFIHKITKNVDYVDIECTMAHKLENSLFDGEYEGYVAPDEEDYLFTYVCGNPNALNYQSPGPGELHDESVCIWPNYNNDETPQMRRNWVNPNTELYPNWQSGYYYFANYNPTFYEDPSVFILEDWLETELQDALQAYYQFHNVIPTVVSKANGILETTNWYWPPPSYPAMYVNFPLYLSSVFMVNQSHGSFSGMPDDNEWGPNSHHYFIPPRSNVHGSGGEDNPYGLPQRLLPQTGYSGYAAVNEIWCVYYHPHVLDMYENQGPLRLRFSFELSNNYTFVPPENISEAEAYFDDHLQVNVIQYPHTEIFENYDQSDYPKNGVVIQSTHPVYYPDTELGPVKQLEFLPSFTTFQDIDLHPYITKSEEDIDNMFGSQIFSIDLRFDVFFLENQQRIEYEGDFTLPIVDNNFIGYTSFTLHLNVTSARPYDQIYPWPFIPGDFNKDGIVDWDDVYLHAVHWENYLFEQGHVDFWNLIVSDLNEDGKFNELDDEIELLL
tara:strand:- start:20736 stop:24854 length:4119 start_codon:yes stop_codon:yes gene_type:complete